MNAHDQTLSMLMRRTQRLRYSELAIRASMALAILVMVIK